MPITPIDIKTNLMANNDASRLREAQKTQEMGLGQQFLVQNQDADQEKVETVQNTQPAESKVIRKEDEGSEKEKSEPDTERRKKEEEETGGNGETAVKPPAIPDGVRGMKIDLKA